MTAEPGGMGRVLFALITRNNKWETMMNEHKIINTRLWLYGGKLLAVALGVALIAAPPLQAAEPAKAEAVNVAPAKAAPAKKPANVKTKKPVASSAVSDKSVGSIPAATKLEPYLELSVGQSHLIRLPGNARLEKVSVDNPNVVQIKVTSLREVVLNARSPGSTVVILKDKSGQTTVMDVSVVGGAVGKAAGGLQGKLQQLLPGEKYIMVASAADTVVLTGTATDAIKVERAVALAEAYSGKKVLNFLQVGAPQQVMLEVKVAEVSKTLTDKLGAGFKYGANRGSWSYSLLAGFLTGAPGVISATNVNGRTSMTLDAAKTDGLVKILAEPTIMAMSGQEGAFLAGGKIYIPVPQVGLVGTTTITLEEKEFGVGLKFTPTVLEDGRINLKVSPEVSEIGAGVTFGTQTLPSITTRRASTTVQLNDGQSFAIGGLIKNNVTENIAAFPFLGEIPILGALFRSTDFRNDRTELLFVITPRLVKPLPADYALPTDGFIEPTRADLFLNGKLEGSPKDESQPAAATAEPTKEQAPAQAPASGGFQMK
jgi:pilus assembly protein CpaC